MTRHATRPTRYAPIACALLLLAARTVHAGELKIENVTVAQRDKKRATVTFDISWTNSWRHGSFHDAAWVFFKARAGEKAQWRHVRLVANNVVNPAGYGQGKDGTLLEFIVPDGEDGYAGLFVRRAEDGVGAVTARGITVPCETQSRNTEIRAFGIEMVYVAEGPFYLGKGGDGMKTSEFHTSMCEDEEPYAELFANKVITNHHGPPYHVTGPGAIPIGRKNGMLCALGLEAEDGEKIPASFPNGYAAFYCMKSHCFTRGIYAAFLNTLTEEQVKARYHEFGHGPEIERSGKAPDYVYSAASPGSPCPWLSWADNAAVAAWAGLRPMTELEYEKMIRGPRKPPPGRDAQLSYWGAAQVNLGGHYERPVSVTKAVGRAFKGTHGVGRPTPPDDWPVDIGGAILRNQPGIGYHLCTSGRQEPDSAFADRRLHQFAAWRAARSAPSGDPAMKPIANRTLNFQAPRLKETFPFKGGADGWGKPLTVLSGPGDLYPVDRRFTPSGDKMSWQGPKDLTATIYLAWDGEALCVGAEVTDDRHVNTQTFGNIGNGDALQIGLAVEGGAAWNIVLALTTKGPALLQVEGADDDTLVKTADCSVKRDDETGITRYGMRLPLSTIGLKPGTEFAFNVMVLDGDDPGGMRQYLLIAPGMTYPTKPELYPRFALGE